MYRKLIYTLVFSLFLFSSCSPGKKISIKRLYHNTTAKYNAFYLANYKLQELENEILISHQEDYSKVLPIFYTIDSSTIEANLELLDGIKEMASKSIEWHKISKWTDDSYFLLGMADFYNAAFDDASNTFKYLNVNSNDKKVRHQSLAMLLRIFVDLEKYDDAAFVIDYLSKETKISRQNKYNIYRSLAHFYARRQDINGQIGAIDQASRFVRNKKELSRLNFILAQLYQNENLDALAYDYYKKAVKGNPPYERSFFAQLYAQKVSDLNQSKDIKKVREYYSTLYKDGKNKDLKDVILYEKALFELKQNNLSEARQLLVQASQESSNNNVQKGYIYEKLANLSISNEKDYRTAKYMVDSALMFFKPTDDAYQGLNLLQKKLEKFVSHYDVIKKNDTLLFLSALSEEEQMNYALNLIKAEEEQIKNNQKKKEIKKSTSGGGFNALLSFGGNNSEQTFYFQNQIALQQGSIEFVRIWGNRPNVDNWRRSSSGFSNNLTTQNKISTETKSKEQPLDEKEVNDKINAILAEIPVTPEQKNQLKESLETAYFELGKLLLIDLKENEMSIYYLEDLIDNYPNTIKKPEALYLLYLAHAPNKDKQELYTTILNSEFPKSPFTLYVNNPGSSTANTALIESSKNYKMAYELFTEKSYLESRNLIETTLETYPLTKITDKFLLLNAMIAAKLEPLEQYISLLEEFISQTEDKELKILAQNMLKVVKNNVGEEQNLAQIEEKKEENIQETNVLDIEIEQKLDDSPFKENPNQTHIFIIPLQTDVAQKNKSLLADLETFHINEFNNTRLRIGNMSLNQDLTIFLVSPFGNKEKAIDYRTKFMELMNSESLSKEDKDEVFIISIENFQELNRRKNLEEYKKFYQKKY
jgi:hypothetical protein